MNSYEEAHELMINVSEKIGLKESILDKQIWLYMIKKSNSKKYELRG